MPVRVDNLNIDQLNQRGSRRFTLRLIENYLFLYQT